MTSHRRRGLPRGVTLMEWMVVILVAAVVLAAAAAWLNQARDVQNRAQCQNNLRNGVLAILGYHNGGNVFPPSGVFAEDAATMASLARGETDPGLSVVPTYFPGAAGAPRGVPMYSWVVPIFPFLDYQGLSDLWTMEHDGAAVSYHDDLRTQGAGFPTNRKVAETSIDVLRCPQDPTTLVDRGNLSYVVNGGFALWHAYPVGWVGGATDGTPAPTAGPLVWAPAALGWGGTVQVARKLGVMFIETRPPSDADPKVAIPWNVRSSLAGVTDGVSFTLLMAENTLTGVSPKPGLYSRGLPTNWATPLPNFTSFFGPSSVCGDGNFPKSLDCTQGGLTATDKADGPGWPYANARGTYTNINYGRNLTVEGSFPFANCPHGFGFSAGFCDGSIRFISSSIDGTVYSKLITPAGEKLPIYCKQSSVSQADFAN